MSEELKQLKQLSEAGKLAPDKSICPSHMYTFIRHGVRNLDSYCEHEDYDDNDKICPHDGPNKYSGTEIANIYNACVKALPAIQWAIDRIQTLEAVLREADNMLPWLRQGTIWVGGYRDTIGRKMVGLDHMFPNGTEKDCDTLQEWVVEANRLASVYEDARKALKEKSDES